MKKWFIVLPILIFFAGLPSYADEWADFAAADKMWDGQKSITNDEFEKTLEALQAKQKQKEEKQRKKKIKKISGGGDSLHPDMNPYNEIPTQSELKKKDDEGQLLNVPVNLCVGESFLDKGFYNVFGEKDKNGEVYLSFYQAHFFKGKVKANETNDDFDSDSINFVKLIPYNEDYIKIVFGSLDFNAYVYMRYKDLCN